MPTVEHGILVASPECCVCCDIAFRFVVSGCHDRKLRAWNCENGAEIAAWPGHIGLPICLKWSLTRCLVASACSGVALWIPDMQRISDIGGLVGLES